MPTLSDIARLIGVETPPASAAVTIDGVASLEHAGPRHIAFLLDERYTRRLPDTRAAAVVVDARLAAAAGAAPEGTVLLPVSGAPAAMEQVLAYLAPPVPRPAGIHPSAVIAASAELGEGAAVGPFVVIGERVRLGAGTILHAGVSMGDDVTVGEGCELFAGVVIRERCTLGSRVVIHANSVIGADGFGYRWDGQRHVKQPHIGTVVIDDDVEIGACTCIDRAKIDETRVGAGTRIDNLVQVGHNVRIGRHCILCAGVGIAGTAQLGDGVVLGGAAGVRDHVKLGDGVQVAAYSAVAGDVAAGELMGGVPALPHRQALREQGALRRLPELLKQLKELQARVAELEAQNRK